MKMIVPNPEYAQAEYEEGHITSPNIAKYYDLPPPLRFRAKDLDEVLRLRDAGKPYWKLAVPSHILVDMEPEQSLTA